MNLDGGFLVYTDGSCAATNRIGAYAWVAIDVDDAELLDGDSASDTTISRMELMGPIDALARILEDFGPCVVLVLSDSKYVVDGITDRTRKRNKNVDLWDILDYIVDEHQHVEFEHVKGHAGDYYNELVDSYAGQLRRDLLSEQK